MPVFPLLVLILLPLSALWPATDGLRAQPPGGGPGGGGGPGARPVPVRVAAVVRMPVAERIEAMGTLSANESVTLSANVTEIVASIHFEDGQRVRAGEVLAELASLEQRALLEESRVRVNEADRQYRRIKALVEQRSASESLLDERLRDLETARALLAALESRLADRLIRAPFDGVLGLRRISPGSLVRPGDPIATLDDDSIMKLDFTLPSIHLSALRPGLAIHARARDLGDLVFRGEVRSIDSRVDPVTRSIAVRAILPNPDRLLVPGLPMTVELLIDPRDAPVIPESALLHRGNDHFVIAVRPPAAGGAGTAGETGTGGDKTAGDGATGSAGKGGDKTAGAAGPAPQAAPVAERRQVIIGTRLPGLVEIRDGLAIGDQVVVHGQDRLRSGQALSIQADPASTAPSAPN